MAALLDIRRRIRSVKSTQQITRAMKMVAAARLRRAQDRIFSARPYANEMMTMLSSVAARTTDRCHPLLLERPIQRQLLVLVTADRGLCGAFNTNLIRAAQLYLDENGRAAGDFAGKEFGGRNNWHGEELLNVAAVETFRRRGEVFSLPTDLTTRFRLQNGAAAAFRY